MGVEFGRPPKKAARLAAIGKTRQGHVGHVWPALRRHAHGDQSALDGTLARHQLRASHFEPYDGRATGRERSDLQAEGTGANERVGEGPVQRLNSSGLGRPDKPQSQMQVLSGRPYQPRPTPPEANRLGHPIEMRKHLFVGNEADEEAQGSSGAVLRHSRIVTGITAS